MAMWDFGIEIPADIKAELGKIINSLSSIGGGSGGSGGGSGGGGKGGGGGADTNEIKKAMDDLRGIIGKLESLSKSMNMSGKADFVQGILEMARALDQVSGKKIEFEVNIKTDAAVTALDSLTQKFQGFNKVFNESEANTKGGKKGKSPAVKAKDNWTSVNNSQLKQYNKIITATSNKVSDADRMAAFNSKYNQLDRNDAEVAKMVQRDMIFLNGRVENWWTSIVTRISNSINKIQRSNPNIDTTQLSTDMQDIQKQFTDFITGANKTGTYDTTQFAQLQTLVANLAKNTASQAEKAEKSANKFDEGKEIEKLNQLLTSITKFRDKNPRLEKSSYSEQLNRLEAMVQQYLQGKQWQSSEDPKADFSRMKGEFAQIIREATQAGAVGQTVASMVSDSFISGVARMFGAFSAYNIVGKLRQMYATVLDIDSSMTNLKRVTVETADAYNKFLDGATMRAQRLGTTVKDVVDATTNFVRLGYNLQDASQLADTAMMYRNVGEVDISTATGDITSVLKAYDMAAESAEHVVDVFDILGNRFATTSAQVGAGLNRSASALKTANNSFEESAAMITAITEITQDSQSAGNALKTLSLRLRSTKTQLAELGEESEGAATTTSKLRKTLQGLTGVDIMRNSSEYKSTYQIMSEIANVWYKLSDAEKAATLELLAGKTRANQVAALLNNWSQAENALVTSLNSAGTAVKENEKYLDSMQGRTQQLKASFETMAVNLIQSENAKLILGVLNDIIGALAKLADGNVIIPIVTLIGGLGHTAKVASREGLLLTDAFRNLFRLMKNDSQAVGIMQQSIVGLTEEEAANVTATNQMARATSALVSNLAVAAIMIAISAYAKYNQAQKEARENAIATAEQINEQTAEYEKNVTAIKKLREQLSDQTLSQDEYNHVKEELIEIQEQIIDNYGQEAQKIDVVNGKLDEQLELYKEIEQHRIEQTINENANQREQAEKYLYLGSYDNPNLSRQLSSTEFSNDADAKRVAEIASEIGFLTYSRNGVTQLDTQTFTNYIELYDALEELKQKLTEEYGTSNSEISKFISDIDSILNKDNFYLPDTDNLFKNETKTTLRPDFGDEKYKQYVQFIEADVQNRIEADKELDKLEEQLSSELQNYNSLINDGDYASAQELVDGIQSLKEQIDARVESIFSDDSVSKYVATRYFANIIEGFMPSKNQELDNYIKELYEAYQSGQSNEFNYIRSAGGSVNKFRDILANTPEIQHISEDLKEMGFSVDEFVNSLIRLGYLDMYNPISVVADSFATIAENAKTATESTNSFTSAISKIGDGSALSYDEINKLLAIDPSLVNSVEQYKNGYTIALDDIVAARSRYIEETRKSYQDEIDENAKQIERIRENTTDAQKQLDEGDLTQSQFDKIVEDNQKHINELENASEYYKFLMNDLAKPSQTYEEIVTKVTNNMKTQTEMFTTANSEMQKFGKLSQETAMQIMSSVENWRDVMEFDGSSFTLKSGIDFENLIMQTSGYNKQLDAMKARLADLRVRREQLASTINSASDVDSLRNQLDDLDASIVNASGDVNSFVEVLKFMLGVASQNEALTSLNEAIRQLDHQLAMGVITEQEYYNKYTQALNKAKEGYEGNDEDFWSFEETAYSKRIANETKAYEDELKQLKAIHEDNLIDDETYLKRKKALDAKYYGAGSLLGGTTEGRDRYFDLQREQISEELKINEDAYAKQKKALENALADRLITYDDYMKSLSELNEKYYGKDTMLGSRKEGKEKYEDNIREIQGLNKDAFDYNIKQLDDALELGKISVAEYWKMYGEYADKYLKNTPQLAQQYQDATRTILTTGAKNMYEDDRKHLDRLFNDGKISLTTYLEECSTLWEKYFKGKKELEDEDYERMKELRDTYKNGVSDQINALKSYGERLTKPLQNQIDVLEDIKQKQDDVYDIQIKKLQLQKQVLEERNKKEKQENDLLKARNELLKAEMKTRLVYNGSGGYTLQRDEEKYQEALKGKQEAERQEQIQKLDDQINAINTLKDYFDTEIATDIKSIQLEMQIQQEPINEMVKILEEILAMETAQYDPEFVNKVLNSEAGKKATSNAEARNDMRRDLFKKYGSDTIYQDLFKVYGNTGSFKALDPRYYMSGSDLKQWETLQKSYGIYTLSGNTDDYIKKYNMTSDDAQIYRNLQHKYALKNPYNTVFSIDELQKTAEEFGKKYNMTADEFLAYIGFKQDVGQGGSTAADKKIKEIESVSANASGGTTTNSTADAAQKNKTDSEKNLEQVSAITLGSPTFNIYVGENVSQNTIGLIRVEANKMFEEYTNMITQNIGSAFINQSSKSTTE